MRTHHPFPTQVGSPEKLRSFLARLRRGEVLGARAMRFCFALDGTLVTTPSTPGAYDAVEPIVKNIGIARELHEAGHTIIIWTDRAMERRSGNAGKAMADVGMITFQQLAAFEIPYDEIIFGKPSADVYVDCKAVNSLGDSIERSLGWDLEASSDNTDLVGGVKPRHFNAVRRVGDDHVEKTGPRSVLRGEIFWYTQIPEPLADLFPTAVSVKEHPDRDLSSVLLTRVAGVTFSHLAINSCVTPGRLRSLLDALHRLHVSPDPEPARQGLSDDALCSNYASKVRKRFKDKAAFFRSFDDPDAGVDAAAMFDTILAFLTDYEARKRFTKAHFIHGDPVFSNVLLANDNRVKFLDMRGALGDTLTTAGDVTYDLSKVYQSLCGYDYIILDANQTDAAKQTLVSLRQTFHDYLKDKYPNVRLRDVKMIVAAHFFCIVPLHDNRNHQKLFLQHAKWLLDLDATERAAPP